LLQNSHVTKHGCRPVGEGGCRARHEAGGDVAHDAVHRERARAECLKEEINTKTAGLKKALLLQQVQEGEDGLELPATRWKMTVILPSSACTHQWLPLSLARRWALVMAPPPAHSRTAPRANAPPPSEKANTGKLKS